MSKVRHQSFGLGIKLSSYILREHSTDLGLRDWKITVSRKPRDNDDNSLRLPKQTQSMYVHTLKLILNTINIIVRLFTFNFPQIYETISNLAAPISLPSIIPWFLTILTKQGTTTILTWTCQKIQDSPTLDFKQGCNLTM